MTRFEAREADWISVAEAERRILAAAVPLPSERVPLLAALGQALAQPVTARARLPPWDNSAMDGYAVRAGEVTPATAERPVSLRVVGEAPAGVRIARAVGSGEAVRIMTGGPLPPGADSVIRVEDTDREEGEPGVVRIRSSRDAGKNVRPGGQDMRPGDVVLVAGTSVGPGQIGVAAAAGHATLEVHRRPRVAILSSGDELRGADHFDDVARGDGIPETNGPTLQAAAQEAGCLGPPPGLARDDPASIRERIDEAREADVLVTSGGASMGEADLLKRVLDEMGFELAFWRVTLRPGSPFSFGWLAQPGGGPLPVFGLPGNPASAFVTFELFVRPFLLRLGGHRRVYRRVLTAVAGEALPSAPRLTHVHRVVLEEDGGEAVARLTGPQGSGLVSSLGSAQGLAVVPPGVGGIPRGEPVRVILLEGGGGVSEGPGYTLPSR